MAEYGLRPIPPYVVGGAEEMVRDLKEKVFATETVRFVTIGGEGRKDVREV